MRLVHVCLETLSSQVKLPFRHPPPRTEGSLPYTPVAHFWDHICREVVQEMKTNQAAKPPLHLSIYDSKEVIQSLKGSVSSSLNT